MYSIVSIMFFLMLIATHSLKKTALEELFLGFFHPKLRDVIH